LSISGSRPWLTLCLVTLLAGLVLRLSFFGVSLVELPTSADEAQVVLQAKNITCGEIPLLFSGAPYQFPVEAYLLAPLVPFMPRNAFGARYLSVLLNFFSLFIFIYLARLIFPRRQTWPAFLLLLFPSTYWLLLQAGYNFVNYNSALTLAALTLLLPVLAEKKARGRYLLSALAGLLGALAFGNNMLCLPLVGMAWVFLFFNWGWKQGPGSALSFGTGFVVGLFPFLAAKWLIPGAHQAVAGSYPLATAFSRIWPLTLTNFPVVMGITPCFFPDFKSTFTLLPWSTGYFTAGYFLFLVLITLVRVIHHLKEIPKIKWLHLQGIDLFVGISWLGLLFFALSRRSHSHTYRYLLPLVWSLPFLLCFFYTVVYRWMKGLVGVLIIFLAFFNLLTAMVLIQYWSKPGFAANQADTLPLKPAIDCLDRLGINRCYATMWLASRIPYETDERILCTQPYNTRFYGWPIPYKEEVDSSRHVAYVLTQSDRFTLDRFEADLKAMSVTSRRDSCGPFTIYYDFISGQEPPGIPVPKDQLAIRASHHTQEASRLKDGDRIRRWGSGASQEKGMWVEIELPSAHRLSGISLVYNRYAHDQAPALKVMARKNGSWLTLLPRVQASLDPFVFLNDHPVYGEKRQILTFPTTQAKALRLEVLEPNPRQDWSMVEIDLYQKGPPL
jgi:hypothetical protein